MTQKRLKGRIFSDQPNKYVLNMQPSKFLLKRLMLNGKKRLKGRIFYAKPNKYIRERPILKGKKWRLKEEDKEDMMSKLPDEILVSIMCCLMMEEAARMSLVSRRWQNIWNTTLPLMPKLTFVVEESGCRQKINVLNNKVVKMHKAPTLDEFLLIAYNLHSKHWHHINTWMDFAAKKHVKKLTLDVSGIDYDTTFLADNFQSLRELDMEGKDVTENFIHRLFSNSPFLERFSLIHSNGLHKLNINKLNIASALNLKYLKVSFCHTLRHLEITSAPNLNTLEITGSPFLESLNISAPNLSHLLLCIKHQHFKFDSYLALLDQIKTLTLQVSKQYLQFPQFTAVEHLELKMYTGFQIPIHRLPDLLKAAPLLNTFSFQDFKVGHPAEDSGLKWLDKHIPSKVEVNQKNYSCHSLKVVKLDIFAGCQYEVEFLMHLLKYAVSVEKIIIQLMPSSDWTDRDDKLDYEDKFDNQYELLCLGCAQLLKTRISQMHPSAEIIIT